MGGYVVATDSPQVSRHQPARPYRLTGYRDQAVLAGSGTVEQMQVLADELNAKES